jgi:single-strand DNA-binding protein
LYDPETNQIEEGGIIMVNKALLIGRLGADPEVRYTPDGTMVANFRLATDLQWKDKNGEKIQRTEWHRIVAYGKLAEICSNYLSKGKLIFIEGRIQTRSWEDKDGVKRSTTEIVASNMQMLDSKVQTRSQDVATDDQPPASPGSPWSPGSESAPDDDVPF